MLYQQARNDWILQLDADEFLSDELRDNLEKLISGDVDAYDVLSSIFCKGRHHFIFHKRMLFKKSAMYFIGATHESAKPLHKKAKIERTEYVLMHEPAYDNLTFAVFQTKWKKLSRIHAKQLLDDFSSIPKWNCPLTGWENHRRIRMKHPILLGMIATPAYHALQCAKNCFKHRDLFFLKQLFFSCLYHIHFYYYLNKYKKNARN